MILRFAVWYARKHGYYVCFPYPIRPDNSLPDGFNPTERDRILAAMALIKVKPEKRKMEQVP